MSRVFVSYSRDEDAAAVGVLVDDLSIGGGHDVWYDRQVPAGQAWWDTILQSIRRCDVFLFVLSDAFLSSEACRAELEYAERLAKVRVPVVVAGRRPVIVPKALGTLQEIRYDPDDKRSALAMIEQMRGLPSSPGLPDPLPTPPGVPTSYLDDLLAPLDKPVLELSEQREIVAELKLRVNQRLASGKKLADLHDALERLRSHSDVRASVRDEVEDVLGIIRARGGAVEPVAETSPVLMPDRQAEPVEAATAEKPTKSVFYYIGVGFVILVVLAIISGDCGGYAF